jgi:hypothetical protein
MGRTFYLLLLLLCHPAYGTFPVVDFEFAHPTARFITPADPAIYYVLSESSDLNEFSPVAIDLADNTLLWETDAPAESDSFFWRFALISLFAPQDADGDGIDDVYELQRPGLLDPLNPNDANDDPDQNGLTHLQEYLNFFFGDEGSPPQFYSRETTPFNFGAPREEAVSREITSFNLGSPSASVEAMSREVSLYQGSGINASGIPQVYSREITNYNLGSPSASIEAVSRELSLYNGSGVPLVAQIPQVYSREVSAFNFGAPRASLEAISREVSVNGLISPP